MVVPWDYVQFIDTVQLKCPFIERKKSTIDFLAMNDSLKMIVTVIISICAEEEMFRRSRDKNTLTYADTKLSIHYIVL